MVLINGQAICLSCGASPSPDADLPEQEEHHHHHHHHAGGVHEEAKAMPDDLARLRILLPHWIEHSDEHVASFQEWAERARELGLEAVAKQTEVAVERMAACDEALAAAVKELEK